MPHNIFHGQPFNPFGLLSDAAQDYLSGDLPAARGRPFLPGMTVNPVTGDRMTNRERIEMNRAARQGLLAPDRFGRVRPSRVDNFMGLPGARVNPNVMIPIEQRDRVPFVQDLAATLGPVAEVAQVGTNLAMKNVVDPTLQYFLGTDPAFQNVDTNYDFDNQTKAAQTETAKSFTGEGGIISDIVQDVQNKYDEQIQKLDTRKALREAERFRMSKDPTAYSMSDFKNDFPEIVQQGEDAIRSGYNEFRKTYKGGNYKEAKDAVTNKLNQLKTEVEDKTSEILENTKNNKNIQNSPASDEEKATSEQQTTQANQEIIKDTLDKASKNPKLSELANNDMMLMAISLLASAEKGEGTAEGLLNAMKAVQEANQTSTESIVTLTDPTTGNQRSYRRDDPAVDEAIAAGAVVRPGAIIDINDPVRAGVRRGGRLASVTSTTVVTVDDTNATDFAVDASGNPVGDAKLSLVLPDGTVEIKTISSISGATITVSEAFSQTPNVNTMDFVTIASTGDATDFGDLLNTSGRGAGCSDHTRGITFLGQNPANNNIIEVVTIQTTGNSKDFGDRTFASHGIGALSNGHGGIAE